jgi:hypothetical protein
MSQRDQGQAAYEYSWGDFSCVVVYATAQCYNITKGYRTSANYTR